MSLTVLLLNQAWFLEVLRNKGHRVVTAGFNRSDFDLNIVDRVIEGEELLQWAEAYCGAPIDRFIYFDNSSLPLLTGLERVTVPTVFYSIDAHHHHHWQRYFAPLFDLTLLAQPDYTPLFTGEGAVVQWMPLWARALGRHGGERSREVSFRGTMDEKLHPGRRRFFQEVGAHLSLDAGEGEYQRVYQDSKIVLNESVGGDLNFRNYEALAYGALLLTPECQNGQREVFSPGRDIVTYRTGDVSDAVSKLQYYLANEGERERIAAAGYEKVRALHTEEVRGAELERILLGVQHREKTTPHLRTALYFLRSYEASLRGSAGGNGVFLSQAAVSFLRSATAREEGSALLGEGAVVASFYLERWIPFEETVAFVRSLWTLAPTDVLLVLRYIALLSESQQGDSARVVASSVSDRPEEFVACAPTLIQDLRQRILYHRG